MENIISGNIVSPDSVSIPTVQTPLRPDQPIVYGRGQAFSVYVKYPLKTKRLLFTINDRTFSNSPPLFQQIVFPNPREAGIAEFFVDTATTLKFTSGLYYWDVFQLRDDGSRDIWSPYNTGTFSIVDFPSSSYIQVETSQPDDIYNDNCNITRTVNLIAYAGEDWETQLKWTTDSGAVNLEDYSIYMPIKATESSTSAIIELTPENGRIVVSASSGLITLMLTSSLLELLPIGMYYYYLELSKQGNTTKIINGNFIVQAPD